MFVVYSKPGSIMPLALLFVLLKTIILIGILRLFSKKNFIGVLRALLLNIEVILSGIFAVLTILSSNFSHINSLNV